jgi:predicted nucleic acid-binding protein
VSFVVVYDSCVLYPNTLRDLLIRIAQAGLVQAKWTDKILDEVFRNLRANRPDLDPVRLDRTRTLMVKNVRDCLVTGYEPLIGALELPDPDDRHVLAAGIKAHAQVVVTNNVRDFPTAAVNQWGIEAKSADEFVLDQVSLDPKTVWACVRQMADACRNPPVTTDDVLVRLEKLDLTRSAAELRGL